MGGNIFNSAVSWAAVVSVFLDTIRIVPRHPFSDSFLLRRQLLLLDVVHPSWWYADITLHTVALNTAQRLAALVTDVPVGHTPTICPLLTSDMSPILLCGLQHFTYSCAIALLIQPSHSAFTDGI